MVAPADLARAAREALPELRTGNLVLEPCAKDTAAAIGLACAAVRDRDPNAVTAFLPTDHRIADPGALREAVAVAIDAARRDALVCLGVRPNRPATGFGYLRCTAAPRAGRTSKVAAFVEKPDLRRAKRFVASGRYLWNAGMFVWRASRFLEALSRHAPEVAEAVRSAAAGRHRAWKRLEPRSVDFAVLEKATGLEAVRLDSPWSDVGTWDAAAALGPRAASGDVRAVGSPGSVVFGGGRLVAIVGVPDVVVVDTPDALLVVAKGRSEEVREVVAGLRREGREDLL